MKFQFWKKEKRPIEQPIDKPVITRFDSAKQIMEILTPWSEGGRELILGDVAAMAFTRKRHVHKNPKKKPQQTELNEAAG